MPDKLAAAVESLDDVPEALREYYVEGDNGFTLAIDGIESNGGISREDFDQVKTALSKANSEAAQRRKALEKWETLGVGPEDVASLLDAEEERQRREAEKKGEYDKLLAQVAKKKDEERAAVESQRDTALSELRNVLVENRARMELEKADAFVKAALPHVLAHADMREIDGKRMAVILDDDGDVRVDGNGKPLGIADLVKEMSEDEEYAMLFKASEATGGGSAGSGGGARGAGGKAFKEMSDEEKADLLEELERQYGQDEALSRYRKLVSQSRVA